MQGARKHSLGRVSFQALSRCIELIANPEAAQHSLYAGLGGFFPNLWMLGDCPLGKSPIVPVEALRFRPKPSVSGPTDRGFPSRDPASPGADGHKAEGEHAIGKTHKILNYGKGFSFL